MSELEFLIQTMIKALVVVALFASLAGFTTYVERKLLAFFQRRLGPMLVGPFGILQLVADMIKLFTKEDIIPQNANKFIFKIAPIISVTSSFLALSAIPFFPEFSLFGFKVQPIVADINVAILFILGATSVGVYGFLFAGVSSHNKWALLGGARTVIQLLSFEAVSGLALLSPIMLIGSLSLIDINNFQSGGISYWIIWKQPVAFVLFTIAIFAETNRTPFDLIEQETEVVSGYATEYSGMRWGMFFIGEYANMFTAAFLVTLIFLGGYNPIWIIPGGLAVILKVSFMLFSFIWVRAAWPHVRPDQLMWLCWKVLMPLAVINILITGFVLSWSW